MHDFTIAPQLTALAEIFNENGARLYAVGGMVRNCLLGYPVNDTDVCSALRIEDVEAMLTARGIECRKKGAAFGTLDIVIGGMSFEYAAFRTERYDGTGSHKPSEVSFAATLEEDAFRRDFTVNAIYLDPLTKEVIDPTGGVKDMERRILRATSPNPALIMRDDGVRILRLCRFAGQLGFEADENTLAAAYASREGLKDISPERIYAELCKLIMADTAYGAGYDALIGALHLLHRSGAIEVLLPELELCYDVKQRRDFHKYDVMEHNLRACAAVPPELVLRWTMLLHDTGKATAFYDHGSMHGHEMYSARIANDVLTRLKAPAALREEVVTLVRWHMFDLKGETRVRKIKRKFVELGRDGAQKLILIREADVHGSGIELGRVDTAERWKRVYAEMQAENAPFTEKELRCTGQDICRWLNIRPCPRVGEVKRALLMHCACKPRDNEPKMLEKITRDIGKGNIKDE